MHLFSTPPENIRKPYGFLVFSGVEKECIGNEWIKVMYSIHFYLTHIFICTFFYLKSPGKNVLYFSKFWKSSRA